MIREDPDRTFTVIPFGYEKTNPELSQYQELVENYKTLTVIKQSPDFILIKNDKTKVYFVEVKYRKSLSEFNKRNLKEYTENMVKYWEHAWFFVATQDGFYFDKCSELIKNDGAMNRLDEKIIFPEIQNKYLEVLREFIKLKK